MFIPRGNKLSTDDNEKTKQNIRDDLIQKSINEFDAWKSVYELSIQLRNFEISQLVQRNNFL